MARFNTRRRQREVGARVGVNRRVLHRDRREPERILRHRVTQYNHIEMQIKWRGFPVDASTWVPEGALRANVGAYYTDVLDDYYRGPAEFEPHMLLGHRIVHTIDLENILQLLVQWKGYPEPTWEPASALTTCNEVQMDYYRDKHWAPMSPEFAQYFQEQMDIDGGAHS